MKNVNEIKIVCIGESGSGKSSMITSMTRQPEILKKAIARSNESQGTKAGTTEATVEYIFVDKEIDNDKKVPIKSVVCQQMSLTEFQKFNRKFYQYLIDSGVNDTDDDYADELNNYAEKYISELDDLSQVFDLINSKECFCQIISLEVSASDELVNVMSKHNIHALSLFDTRGIGDNDELTRFIPGGVDLILVMGKMENPAPNIRKGLEALCKMYSEYIPIIFVGKHMFGEDGVNIFSSNNIEDYLESVTKYNKDKSDPIWEYYYKPCKPILDKLYSALKNYIADYRVAHLPLVKNLNSSTASPLKKFYLPACYKIVEDCVNIIVGYRGVFDSAIKQVTFENMRKVFLSKEVYENIQKFHWALEPRDYSWDIDWRSVAYGYSCRNNISLSYSYNAVGVGLYKMLNSVIANNFRGSGTQEEIIRYILKTSLETLKETWYYGWYDNYTYTMINCRYDIVARTRDFLKKHTPSLNLDNVVCTRHAVQYDKSVSIEILLYERSVEALFKDVISNSNSSVGSFIDMMATNTCIS
jgi:GTPase SAR1 family protein